MGLLPFSLFSFSFLSLAPTGLGAVEILFLFFFLFLFFETQGFSVALEPVVELDLVDQAGLKLTEIHPPLPPECWD